MFRLSRSVMDLLWWLRSLLYLWVKTKVVPEEPRESLGLAAGTPVCYVLPSRSISDLLVLDQTCRKFGLQRPRHKPRALRFSSQGAYIYLRTLGAFKVSRPSKKAPPSPLSHLVRQATLDPNMEVQIVPVSVFWGRNPGRNENSIFKLLFFDDEHAGWLQKIFIIFAQGRSNFLAFGKPISLRQMVEEQADSEQVARKLGRVLRVHFHRQRVATMGPSLPPRERVVSSLLQSKIIRAAIVEESTSKKISIVKAEDRAYRYLREIAADTNHAVVRLWDRVLSWLWNKIFDGVVVNHAERVRAAAGQDAELIYLPSHRSHMDYLLLAYTVFFQGLASPHTAAGVNLNFWPVGGLLRRGGAFYLRRSFSGNRLYAICFNEYVHHLITKGHPLKFYLEGGRSRTGRLLPPKVGMLTMVVQSYLRNPDRPIILLPIYIGYDRVMEVRTYQSELRGKGKKKESFGQLFQARKALRSKFGKAYIGFGQPIDLGTRLGHLQRDWQQNKVEDRPLWMAPFVANLARDTMVAINASAVVSPLSLFALIILSAPNKALPEDEILLFMEGFLSAMGSNPYSRDVVLPTAPPKQLLEEALGLCKVGRFEHVGGDVLYLDEREAIVLAYYRNNILHLIAVPALIASFFQHNDSLRVDDLQTSCEKFFPFLSSEFFLPWTNEEAKEVVRSVARSLVDLGLLRQDGKILSRPTMTERRFGALRILSRVLGQTLEKSAVSMALLAQQDTGHPVDRATFETECQAMAQRVSILSGTTTTDSVVRKPSHDFIDVAKSLGYLTINEAGDIVIEPSFEGASTAAMRLLSADLRQSITRTES